MKQQLSSSCYTRRPACIRNSAPAVALRSPVATQASLLPVVPRPLAPASTSPASSVALTLAPTLAPIPTHHTTRTLHVCAAAAKSAEKDVQFDVSVAVEELSVCRRRAAITVPASAVKAIFKRGVKRIERDVVGSLRGWQAGKPLPLSMVITQVGGQEKFKTFCLEELLLEALPRGVTAARGGRAVDPNSVEVPSADFPGMLARYDPAREFSFTVLFDVAPPLVWRTPLDQLTVTIRDTGDFQTDAAAADDLIRQYRKQHGFSRVVAGRGLQMGDTLVVDMAICGKSSRQPLPGLTHTRISFDTEQDVLGITAGMLGMCVGESRTFDMCLPEDYEVELWQDMPVSVTIKVHEVFEWTLPEFDDEYVATHHTGKWRSAAEMREALITSTAIQRVQRLDQQLEDAVVQVVADALDMEEVPPRMVEQLGERQFQAQLLRLIEDRIGSQEDIEKLATEEMAQEFVEQRRKDLEDQVKFNLAVDDIFATRGLELDDGAVQAEYELRVRQMEAVGQPYEREELLEDVRETVKSVTVIEWLKDNIKREVVPYNSPSSGDSPASASRAAAAAGQQPVAA